MRMTHKSEIQFNFTWTVSSKVLSLCLPKGVFQMPHWRCREATTPIAMPTRCSCVLTLDVSVKRRIWSLCQLHGPWLLWRCEMKDQWCLPYLRDRVYRALTPPAPTHRIHYPIASLLSSQVKSFQSRFEALGFKYSHKPFANLHSQGLQKYPL